MCREWLVSTSFDGTAGLVPHDEEETGLEVRHGVVDAPQRRFVHHIARHPAPTQIIMVLCSGACAVMGWDLMTNRKPMPSSKMSSGATRESAHVTTTA